jgi:hypothetical protein
MWRVAVGQLLGLLVAALAGLEAAPAAADQRLALVVGNAEYV